MNRLRQAGDSHYDVLGLSPNASADEIDSAFRRLIDGEGYKVGVPLNRQWLRARQIKDAHSTLGDPAMRQAYDDSLRRPLEPAPWAMTAEDPATDELVMPEPGTEAPVPAAPEPDETPEPDPENQLPDDDQPPVEPEPTSNDNEIIFTPSVKRRVSARTWGAATAAASVLGLVLLSTWPGLDRQSSAGEENSRVAAAADEDSSAGLGFVEQVLGTFDRAVPKPVGAAPEPPRAPGSVRNASADRNAEGTGELAARSTADAQPQPIAASTDNIPAIASSPPVETVEDRGAAPTPTPPADPAPAIATAVSGSAESSDRLVHIPPQWVGGGPTDADNPRGRYQGSLTVQVNVEADGSVSKCAPVRGSGNSGLDEMTCRLVRDRARFSPAQDAQGQPVAAQAYTTIVWGRNRRR